MQVIVEHVLLVRLTVTSPHTFFSQEDTSRALSQYQTEKAKRDRDRYYHGCDECYGFSMLFGGLEKNGKWINSEEAFEIAKGEFVQHFNENHRDIPRHEDDFGDKYKKFTPDEEEGFDPNPTFELQEEIHEASVRDYQTLRGTITEEMVDNEQ